MLLMVVLLVWWASRSPCGCELVSSSTAGRSRAITIYRDALKRKDRWSGLTREHLLPAIALNQTCRPHEPDE
jgi:hypothetical protein